MNTKEKKETMEEVVKWLIMEYNPPQDSPYSMIERLRAAYLRHTSPDAGEKQRQEHSDTSNDKI